ncbi:MAG: Rpn family recombination-promoting nuclease/putative transposase [Lachnospiraceae bacterium]|nr:Rpn family recombination-promoting nuclease/putative transposase [Lachnospiraceae bacterium]
MKRGICEEVRKEEAKRAVQQMTLLDNFLFREVMKDRNLFQLLVSILLEREIEFLEKPQTEKILGTSPLLREIRLDVFNMDMDKHIYAVEMQKNDTRNLQKRSRLYQAQMDVSLLPTGTKDFNEIRDVFLIMICPFDLFGKGACRYTFYEVCEEYPDLRLEDGGNRMFINTKGTNREKFSKEFVELLDYINAPVEEAENYTTTEAVRQLHEGIQKLKELERTGMRYMQRWEERILDIQEGRREGREEGRKEGESIGEVRGRAGQIVEMGIEFGLSVSDILARLQEKLNISLSEAEEYFGIYSKL